MKVSSKDWLHLCRLAINRLRISHHLGYWNHPSKCPSQCKGQLVLSTAKRLAEQPLTNKNADVKWFRNISRVFEVLCRGACNMRKRAFIVSLASRCLMPLAHLLVTQDDDMIMHHACWALACLCERAKGYSHLIVNELVSMKEFNTLYPRLLALVRSRATAVLEPALVVIGHIVCNDQRCIRPLLDDSLDSLTKLLSSPLVSVSSRACWVASNVIIRCRNLEMRTIVTGDLLLSLCKLMTRCETQTDVFALVALATVSRHSFAQTISHLFLTPACCVSS